jgi:hypothetical protein
VGGGGVKAKHSPHPMESCMPIFTLKLPSDFHLSDRCQRRYDETERLWHMDCPVYNSEGSNCQQNLWQHHNSEIIHLMISVKQLCHNATMSGDFIYAFNMTMYIDIIVIKRVRHL